VFAQVFNLLILTLTVAEGDKEGFFSGSTLTDIVKTFVIAVCILIVAIPEGMPLAVSLAMALSIDKLKDDSILIKNLEAIQICATLHDVCIGKTGTLTMNHMNVKKMSLLNRSDILEFHGDKDFFDNQRVIPEIRKVIERAIIGGTQAWLGINNDYDHLIKTKKMELGYREPSKEELAGGEGNFGPYHEPKGNDIEESLLQFLLDTDVDVHARLVDRNRNEDVVCYIPFSNKDKIKITARMIPAPQEWANPDAPEVYVVVQGTPEMIHHYCN
jgi:magnesium-transporting ATPase (P-type)